MPSRDPRVDAYIGEAADFAQPILGRLREAVHAACPDVEEAIKWGMPAFVYAGGLLCTMAAFKQHVSFGFWRHAEVMGEGVERDGMGSFGKMRAIGDLPPPRRLAACIRKAAGLNASGRKPVRKPAKARPAPALPPALEAALGRNPRAKATFDAFPPSHRREYVDWIAEARREDTRQRRVAQAIEWLAEGKPRNWKYMRR